MNVSAGGKAMRNFNKWIINPIRHWFNWVYASMVPYVFVLRKISQFFHIYVEIEDY